MIISRNFDTIRTFLEYCEYFIDTSHIYMTHDTAMDGTWQSWHSAACKRWIVFNLNMFLTGQADADEDMRSHCCEH